MSSSAFSEAALASLEAKPDLPLNPAASASCSRSLPDYVERVARAFVAPELEAVRCISVASSDGGLTTLYEYGSQASESIVLLPPYGMTFVLVARLARLLAKRHHVVIWESKGSPDASVAVSDADFSLSSQAAQFARIVEARRLHEVHFVGWCQAAQIASYAVSHGLVGAKSMSWIAPAGFGYSLLPSEFDRCALPVYLEIERQGLTYAEKFRRVLDKHALVTATEANIAEKLTMLHLADAQATHVFSRYMRAYEENKAVAKLTLPAAVGSVPTLVMHSRDDTFSHFSESVQIAKKHSSVRLQLLENGGHLQVFNAPPAIAAHILGFVDSVGQNLDDRGAEAAASPLS